MKTILILLFIVPNICFAKIKIAIIDSGISKQKLENVNYKKGFNFELNSNQYPKLNKDNNHGTFLVSVLSGFPEQEKNIEIIPIQFADIDKAPGKFNQYIKSLEYAIAQDVDIISLSIVRGFMEDKREIATLKKATKKGIKIFVASGNKEESLEGEPVYPCSYKIKGIICVGNIDSQKKITSSWGKSVDIYVKGSMVSMGENGELTFKDGSSVSTAIVAHQYAKFKVNKGKDFLKFLKKNNVLYKRNGK